ncbi:MAG: EAL domain-containing protein [Burkholderiales bacterium]|nr:EAL domain-containing protein [Burkholderiales bacterium]
MPTLRLPFARLTLALPAPSLMGTGQFVLIALIYCWAATASMVIAPQTANVNLLWLPAGVAIAALLRRGPGLWPAILVGALAVLLSNRTPLILAIALAVSQTIGPMVATRCLRRLAFHHALDHRRDLWHFCLIGAVAGPLLTACLSVLSLGILGSVPLAQLPAAWLYGWLGAAVGTFLLGVPLLTMSRSTLSRALGGWRWTLTFLLMGACLASGLLAFSTSAHDAPLSPLIFLPPLLLCWMAVRSGIFASSLTALLVTGAAAYATATGRGPFFEATMAQSIAVLWIYACTLSATPSLLTALVGELRSIDERYQLSAKLFEHLHEGLLITDANHRILDVNPTFSAITGFSREEMLGTIAPLMRAAPTGSATERQQTEMRDGLQASGSWRGETVDRRRNGEPCTLQVTVSAVKGQNGQIRFHALAIADITQAQAQRAQLERQAHTDELTGLPNRARLAHLLREAMVASEREGFLLTICYLDLDHFKPVNDNHGHEAGDRLLVDLSDRLRRSLRHWASGDDAVARLGGDEFVLLLRTATLEEGRHAVERVMRSVSQPYGPGVGTGPLSITASIGATVYPIDKADADTLLRHADHAMYGAKQAGRNGYLFFDAEHDRRTEQHFEALGRVQDALDSNEFVLYYQPKVDMRLGRVLGVEALLRWKHPQHGVIAPAQFLPLIEHTGLSARVGDWVLQEGIEQLAKWQRMGLDITVSVNISARHLQEPSFAKLLAGLLGRHTTPVAQRLVIEVLETAALADVDYTCALMEECRDLGVRFALDDFGTGYSTFTYLKRLPLDFLKIDRSFVLNMLVDRQDMAIVEGVIDLSETFGCKVVAEGVESPEQAQRLIELGCDVGQGNGIAQAMPVAEVYDWVRNYKNSFPAPRRAATIQ